LGRETITDDIVFSPKSGAVFAVVLGWAFVVSRIHADCEQTLMAERNRLRAVATALQDGMSAMLNDGVGAAVASANELQAGAGLINASREDIVSTLQKQLTGGAYVRFILS
jgi:hypothetical protein